MNANTTSPGNECKRCDGTGQRFPAGGGNAYTCPTCHGQGWTGEPLNDGQRLQVALAESEGLKHQLAECQAYIQRRRTYLEQHHEDMPELEGVSMPSLSPAQCLAQREDAATARAYREVAAMLLNGEMSPGRLATYLIDRAKAL